MKRASILTLCLSFVICLKVESQVKAGADMLFEKYFHLIEGKNIGLVTNHSAMLSNGKHLADALSEDKRTKLIALFGPEHGIRGDAPAGKTIQSDKDEKTGLPAYSLYGKINKPTDEMLKGIDVLLFDIFDVGVRFYTYESTLSLAMEAAAEKGIPYIVLDRPNPIRGTWVEGFIREDSLKSFVGLHPITAAHGLTMGELAEMINNEGWLKAGVKAKLTVIKAEGWKRDMWYDQTGLKWVKPSPNIPTLNAAIVYPGTCFFEGTNLSEGRGTERPFEYIGAPYVDGKKLADELNGFNLKGVTFEPVQFTPKDIAGAASNPKHKGFLCGGVFVHITDRNSYEPVKTGVYMICAVKKLFPNEFKWRGTYLNKLSGSAKTRLSIDAGESPETIAKMWNDDVQKFIKLRGKYLLYK
ncbi:MAG: DUF1343 domain-containing protein [Ignavibacteriales bacterium]|nr:DUF1343 domain-containing protein [Ignavibacteriales bacterium]